VAIAEHGDQHFLQWFALADNDPTNRSQNGIEFFADRTVHEQTH
jgi:hypothetical protein